MSVSEVSASQRQNSPYAAVGVLITTWSDGSQGAGTCAVIGRNDVLTALHCVYDPDKGGWAEKLEFYFGADYNSKTNSFDSSDWVYSLTSGFTWEIQGWPTAAFKDSANNTMTPSEAAYDVAIIGVSRPIGDITGWFGLDSGKNISAKATQVGYPVSSTGMMTSEIMVTKNLLWEVYEAQADNMGAGSSGGPLFTSDNQIIGVKSSGNSTFSTWTDIGHLFEEIVSITEDNDLLLGNKAIYSLTAPKSANEGGTASFTLTTKNVTAGTAVPYTISGVSAADISGSLSGTAVVNTSGVATISVTLVNDNLTEGAETLTVTAGGASASTTVNDTSKTVIAGNTLDVIVDLFGNVSMLKGLIEVDNGTVHTLSYNGTVFNYAEVDPLITTVVRNGEFTAEFAQEIADAYPSAAGIKYNTVVTLLGVAAIDDLLISVAGADGFYVL